MLQAVVNALGQFVSRKSKIVYYYVRADVKSSGVKDCGFGIGPFVCP